MHSSDRVIWDFQNLQENISGVDFVIILKKAGVGLLTISASKNFRVTSG